MKTNNTTGKKENVWDYPRPPRLEKVTKEIKIIFNNETIALSTNSYRVLETSHPPVYYIPLEDINRDYLQPASGSSFCEWKGKARYYDLNVKGKIAKKVGWYYPEPTREFSILRNYVAFYAGPMDACYVGNEKVIPQPGSFYGGWITSNLIGPFKGESGTIGW